MAVISYGRQTHRMDALLPCTVSWNKNDIAGTAKNISYDGIAVTLPVIILPKTQEPIRISLQDPIVLSVTRVHARIERESFVIGFRVTKIESGEQLWKQWNTVSRFTPRKTGASDTVAPQQEQGARSLPPHPACPELACPDLVEGPKEHVR